MSEAPFMKLWVGDFSRDTAHLSDKEVGQYLLLLMAMWGNGGKLPSDPKRLKRIARAKVCEAVMSFFDDDGQGGITQKRLQKELKKARDLSDKNKQNIEARWNKNKDLADTNVLPNAYRHSQSQEVSKKDTSLLRDKRARPRRRLPEDWQPKAADLNALLSEGFSQTEIQDQVVRFRDYWTGHGKPMADWSATFRNWVRRSAEMGRGQGPPQRESIGQAAMRVGQMMEMRQNGRIIDGETIATGGCKEICDDFGEQLPALPKARRL